VARRLSDLVGADVGLHVGKNFLDSYPERTYPARLIIKLNEAKRLGEKTGSGFYKYDARRKPSPDPSLAPIVEASRKVSLSCPLSRAAICVPCSLLGHSPSQLAACAFISCR
jgi:enoyl-CoA hydratase/3-hydroxyacyl-CoA dehydrogenase